MDAIYFIATLAGIGYAPTITRAVYCAICRKIRHYDYTPQRTGLINCSK